MTIELTLDDLTHLIEMARSNGHSAILYMARSTDGKRCSIVITPQAKRKRNRQPPAAQQAAPEG
jgi:hypothetical protein